MLTLRPIVCTSNPKRPNQQRFSKQREALEKSRKSGLKRIQEDLRQISSREKEFAKDLLEAIIPVRISINEEAIAKYKNSAFINVEYIDNDKEINEDFAKDGKAVLDDE